MKRDSSRYFSIINPTPLSSLKQTERYWSHFNWYHRSSSSFWTTTRIHIWRKPQTNQPTFLVMITCHLQTTRRIIRWVESIALSMSQTRLTPRLFWVFRTRASESKRRISRNCSRCLDAWKTQEILTLKVLDLVWLSHKWSLKSSVVRSGSSLNTKLAPAFSLAFS